MNGKRKIRFSLVGTLFQSVYFLLVVVISIAIYERAKVAFADNMLAVFIILLICVFFFALLSGLIDVLRRRLTIDKPVDDILDFTSRIANGDFKSRLPLKENRFSPVEFPLIADNLNKMAEELEKNEVLKEDFIANVSHEMKTPLTILSGYAKALKEEDLDAKTRKEYLTILVTTSERLSALVKNILSLSRLEAGRILPEKKEVQADEILSESILLYEEMIEKKNIDLVCDIDEIRYESEPSYLKIVYTNILSNAIKFTRENGTIHVLLKKDGTNVVFQVQDQGPGIKKENLSRIFEKFYQEDTSHAKEGNGLGLALVKKVIDRLGGEIRVESTLGVGSTFTVIQKFGEKEN